MDMREAFELRFEMPEDVYWDERLNSYYHMNWLAEIAADLYQAKFDGWQAALQSQPAIGSRADPVAYCTLDVNGRPSSLVSKVDFEDLESSLIIRPLVFAENHPAPTAQDSKVPEDGNYTRIFNAIAHATKIEAGAIAISVKNFKEAMLSAAHSIAEKPKWPTEDEFLQRAFEIGGADNDEDGYFFDSNELKEFVNYVRRAAHSIAEKPDYTEQPLAMVAEKPKLSVGDLLIIRQWYNCGSDVNPKFLNADGFDDASVIQKVSALIDAGLQRPQPPESSNE